jgi:hypothetical protein
LCGALIFGCYSYGIAYQLLPTAEGNERPISQEEVDRAIALVERISNRSGMLVDVWPEDGVTFADGTRFLIGSKRVQGALRGRPAAEVYLSAVVGPAGAFLRFSIHDVRSGRKGELVEMLDHVLEPALREEFPERRIERSEGKYGPEFFAG